MTLSRQHAWLTGAVAATAMIVAGCSAGEAPKPAAAPRTSEAPAPATPGVQSPAAAPAVQFSVAPAAYLGPLPPLPATSAPAARPPEVLQAVYTFAARHPEVLHYVPCFCGCQHAGHKDNDDCFISGREADGRPRWEPHGMT